MESKYYKWNKRGSRIIIDSGYKTFDNYVICISKGDVVGGGQYSNYIRPYNETICNGNISERGHLRNYDLQYFDFSNYYSVKKYVETITENNSCCLYQFYTFNKYTKEKNIIGYIVEQNNEYKIFNNNNYYKEKKQKCLELIVKILEEK